MITKKCLICGKEFKVFPYQIKRRRGKYCSRKCFWEGLKGHFVSKEAKKKMSKMKKRNPTKYWLGKIRPEMMGKNNPSKKPEVKKKLSGRNHWNWKGGITPENHLVRNSTGYREWRRTIFKRDDYTCWICEERGGKMHPHHLKRFADYPKLRLEKSNGLTLCDFCHRVYTDFGGKS